MAKSKPTCKASIAAEAIESTATATAQALPMRDLDKERKQAIRDKERTSKAQAKERASLAMTRATYQAASLACDAAISSAPLWDELEETLESGEQAASIALLDRSKRDGRDTCRLHDSGSPSLGKVAATIIRRINYPKALCGKQALYKRTSKLGNAGTATQGERNKSLTAKGHALLSKHDESEVFQTCALVLTARGLLDGGTLERDTWKALFLSCRETLGINTRCIVAESTDPQGEDFQLVQAVRKGHDSQAVAVARQRLAIRLRYWHACLIEAKRIDASRKRKAAFRGNLATLRLLSNGLLVLRDFTDKEHAKASIAKGRMLAAIASGESSFDTQAASMPLAASQAASLAACMARLD